MPAGGMERVKMKKKKVLGVLIGAAIGFVLGYSSRYMGAGS